MNNAIRPYRHGVRSAQLGEFRKAIEHFNNAIRLQPNYSRAYLDRGKSKMRLRMHEDAIRDFTKTLSMTPRNRDALVYRGLCKDSIYDHRGAVEDFSKAIGIDSLDRQAYYYRGMAKLTQNDIGQARKDLLKAADLGYDPAIKVLKEFDNSNLNLYEKYCADSRKTLQKNKSRMKRLAQDETEDVSPDNHEDDQYLFYKKEDAKQIDKGTVTDNGSQVVLAKGENTKRASANNRKSINEGLDSYYEEQYKRIQAGRIVYQVPDTMEVGVPVTISVRMAKSLSLDIAQDLQHGVPAKVDTIQKVGKSMILRLFGESFIITPLNSVEQLIPENDYSTWEWRIIPQESGQHKLKLKVTLVVNTEHGDKSRDYDVFTKEIHISVDRVQTVLGLVSKHWESILGALGTAFLAGIGVFVRNKLEHRRTKLTKVEKKTKKYKAK